MDTQKRDENEAASIGMALLPVIAESREILAEVPDRPCEFIEFHLCAREIGDWLDGKEPPAVSELVPKRVHVHRARPAVPAEWGAARVGMSWPLGGGI